MEHEGQLDLAAILPNLPLDQLSPEVRSKLEGLVQKIRDQTLDAVAGSNFGHNMVRAAYSPASEYQNRENYTGSTGGGFGHAGLLILQEAFGPRLLVALEAMKTRPKPTDADNFNKGYSDNTLLEVMERVKDMIRRGRHPYHTPTDGLDLVLHGIVAAPPAEVPTQPEGPERIGPAEVPQYAHDIDDDDDDDDDEDEDDEDEGHDYENCEECICEDCERWPSSCCGLCDQCGDCHTGYNDRTEESPHGDRYCRECEHFCEDTD